MALIIPSDVKTKDAITIQDVCDFPQGHCYGEENGVGGGKEVWTLNAQQTKILAKERYLQCKHCGKYVYEETI